MEELLSGRNRTIFFIRYSANFLYSKLPNSIQSETYSVPYQKFKKILNHLPRGIFRAQKDTKKELLEKKSWQLSAINYSQKALSFMFTWVLNTPLKLLTIFEKSFILDVSLGSRYTSDKFKERQNNCKICLKESFQETLHAKTKKWFLRNFWEKLYKEMISFSYFWQVLKESSSCISRESCFNF